MRAVVLNGPGQLAVEDVELLAPSALEVIIETSCGLACLTDVIQRSDGGGLAEPHIRGHVGVGTVAAVGGEVTRVRPGDRVLVPTRPQCGSCFWCGIGQAEHCELTTRPAAPAARRGDGTLLRGSARVGSFAQYMKVAQAQTVLVPADLGDGEIAVLGCGGGAGLGAVLNTAQVRPGASVLVIGAGVFGLAVVQAARISGASSIIAVDPELSRRELATRAGATVVCDQAGSMLRDHVRALTAGRGVDIGFDCVGDPAVLSDAIAATRIGGDVVCGGFGSKSATVELNFNDLGMRGRRLLSCQYGSTNILRDIPRYLELIETGQFDAAMLVTGECGLDDLDTALDAQGSREQLGVLVRP